MESSIKNNYSGVKLYSKNKKSKTLIWWAESTFKINSDGKVMIEIFFGQDGRYYI